MKLLLIEDNLSFGRNLKKGLEDAGWNVDLSLDGEQGLFLVENEHYDVVVLDWVLPKISGIELLQRIRAKSIEVPTILITANGSLQDRVHGLNEGADDYLVKPFELVELIARIHSLFRRSKGKSISKINLGGLTLNLSSQKFTLHDKALELTAKEFDLLAALISQSDRVVQRAHLMSMIYLANEGPGSNSLDVLIARIRRKIAGSGIEISTSRGKGFILRVAKNPAQY